MYTNMQLKATIQNGRLKSFRSDQWNLSSAVSARLLPSFLSAYQSMNTSTMPENSEKTQIPNPTHITELIKPLSWAIRRGSATPPKTDANLATVILRPRANPSSFPLNHYEIIADCATDMHSPPRPNIPLPESIITSEFFTPPRAKTNYPSVSTVVNKTSPILQTF